MLKKLIGLVALTGVVGIGAVSGCSVTTTTTTTDASTTGTGTATGTGTTTTPKPDSGVKPDASASCYDEEAALAVKGTAPAAGTNKCTSGQIGEFKTKCLGAGATGCDAFIEANKDCGRCIFGKLQGDTTDAPMPALIPVSDDSVSPNIASCAALVIGRPDCAIKLTEQVVCTSSACSTCESDADDTACSAKASEGICKQTIDKACNDAVNAAAAQWQPICRGTAFDDTYVKVANYMCGAGGSSTDAGGGG